MFGPTDRNRVRGVLKLKFEDSCLLTAFAGPCCPETKRQHELGVVERAREAIS